MRNAALNVMERQLSLHQKECLMDEIGNKGQMLELVTSLHTVNT